MHISARAVVGLAGLASISSGLPTRNTTAPVLPTGVYLNASAVTNTTKTTTNTTTISASALPEVVNATEKLNTTTVVPTATNCTEKVDEDNVFTADGFWMPGPVVIPADGWENIHEHSSYLMEEEEEEDLPADSESRRLTPEPKEPRRSSHVEANNINKRDGPGDPLPPRGRTLADHMENHGQDLPECYKRCMRSEDGKASMHMGQDTLGTICGVKWPLFAWWSEHHIYWCVNGPGGCDDHERHREAYRWLKWTCGDKPK